MKSEKTVNNIDKKTRQEARLLEEIVQFRSKVLSEWGKVIIGQKSVLEEILIALLAGGHLLLIGIPGLGKTSIARTLAELLDLKFGRIQFTPDLMPADILGTEILQESVKEGQKYQGSERKLVFERGPIFAHLILADEINRTPPKTQAALLEAMQEHQVTIRGKTRTLEEPFFVLATQNPIEQEGTYSLPEAQLDRFLLCSKIDYPGEAQEEIDMVLSTMTPERSTFSPILTRVKLLEFQAIVQRIVVPRNVAEFAVNLVRKSRPQTKDSSDFIKHYLDWGAGPRAGQGLIAGAKTIAALNGNPVTGLNEVRRIAPAVLRHRLVLNYLAKADGVTEEQIVEHLIEEVSNDV